MRARLIGTLFVLLVAAAAAPAQPSLGAVVERDVVYGTADGIELKLDFARPDGAGPYPCVVCIHGGGWQLGTRAQHHFTLGLLSRNGFAVATVTYRLAPKYKLPAAYEDAKCAVRFLRAKAKEFRIDPERMAALGDSAGGAIALMVGLTGPDDGFEGSGGHAGQSSRVHAVVNFFAPGDFATLQPTPEGLKQIRQAYGKAFEKVLADAVGSSDRSDKVFQRLSPLTYVRKGAPPILTLHGEADPLVPVDQARQLHAALKKAGVPEDLVIVEKGGHGWGGEELERTNRVIVDFLVKQFVRDDPAGEKDGKSDAKARKFVEEFGKALAANDAERAEKLVTVPFAVGKQGKLEVIRDSAALKQLISKAVAAGPGSKLDVERVFTYQSFSEIFADLVKDADRKLLAGVVKNDDRVLVIQVRGADGKQLGRRVLMVGWSDGHARLVGIGE